MLVVLLLGPGAPLNLTVRSASQADTANPVLVPGDPERAHMAHVDEQGGVRYVQQQVESSVSAPENAYPPYPVDFKITAVMFLHCVFLFPENVGSTA